MKHQADKNRSERQFAEEDMVFLKLQPYIQSSLAPQGNNKLLFKYFGPYKILQRVGAVAYKLDLPPPSQDPSDGTCFSVEETNSTPGNSE
jgi:hypothetical protein